MTGRAGVVVTGTEVLSGIVTDRNGPWLSERLREQGLECAQIIIVGDRPGDVRAALEQLAALDVDVIVTSGGLGPTADDLTAAVVAEFAGRPLTLDEALEDRIWKILETLTRRWPDLDEGAIRAANRKQALVPDGATVLEPVGTAPGLVVPGPVTVVVLPGPPRELQPMWSAALATDALRAVLGDGAGLERGMLRLFGIPESEIARTLEQLPGEGVGLEGLEITTCLRRGEIEIATVYPPSSDGVYAAFVEGVRAHHGAQLFSQDGLTVDAQVAAALRAAGATVSVAESCTGGLMAGRLTELAGSSAYVAGGHVVYANEAKVAHAGVPMSVIEAHGAVSAEVAAALADGARASFKSDYGIGITGIAGPDGGSEEKPVGTVCFSVSGGDGRRLDRSLVLPGGRADIRERSTTVAMHLLRRLLS
ncbi:MAG: competence/damage-inducible protein A [Solirubrobacteraceae bacterium]